MAHPTTTMDEKEKQEQVARRQLIDALNEDLEREYQAIIAYVVYSQVIKGAKYMTIAKELEKHAGEELRHALTISRQIDYLGGTPGVTPRPVEMSDEPEDLLRFDLSAALTQSTPQVNPEGAALAEFRKDVDAYVAFQKKVAATFGAKLDETANQAEIAAREKLLGDAIRKARAEAKPGDIFNPVAVKVFKRLIVVDYKSRAGQKRRLVEGTAAEEIPAFRPTINQTYPSSSPLATFPATLLAGLPALPEEVEYRMVGDYEHLVLRDIEANLIIDYVLDVLP